MNGKQYAERIGVPHGTIKRWLSEGLPAKRRMPQASSQKQVEVLVEEADAWVKANKARSLSFSRRSVIYFAQRDDLAIKIGWTSDVMRRVFELRKLEKVCVELLACVPGNKPDELALHARFAEHRIGDGEWFSPDKTIIEHIASLGRVA